VKSPIALFILIASALSGCGQTGPLYMPTPPAKKAPAPANATLGSTPLATPAPTPVPSPGATTAQPSPTSVPPQQ